MGEASGVPGGGATPPRLAAGGLVAGGRYELREPHGGVAGQAFWRAHDKRLGREVALTFVDPLPGEEAPGSATAVLDRTVALTAVYSDGLARVLDVIRGRAGGIVVSEWVPGRSLAAAAAVPDPDRAVAAVRGLADAAARAEEAGLVLALDTPDRIRLTEDGRALLAFPGVGPRADTRGDVRGLGAVLYSLLTGTWPTELPAGSAGYSPTDGRPEAAPRGDDDEVLDPTEARPGVPPESAVLAMRSLDGSSVSSAATVRSMISDAPGATTAMPRRGSASASGSGSGFRAGSRAGVGAAAAGGAGAGAARGSRTSEWDSSDDTDGNGYGDHSGHGGHGGWDDAEPYEPPDERTQRRRWGIMAGAGVAAVIAMVLVGLWMFGAFAGSQNDTPLNQQLDAIERAAQQSREAEASRAAAAESDGSGGADEEPEETTAAASPSTPVEASTAAAWQPASSPGTAENSANAPNVLDGDPSTSWSTDTYNDQFGDSGSAYKPGLGLMLTLSEAEAVRQVVVDSEDDGVRFEIRAADSASPSSLDDTTLLGRGTVQDGEATVTIDDPEESEYVLVWITRLATDGPQAHRATISEVTLTR